MTEQRNNSQRPKVTPLFNNAPPVVLPSAPQPVKTPAPTALKDKTFFLMTGGISLGAACLVGVFPFLSPDDQTSVRERPRLEPATYAHTVTCLDGKGSTVLKDTFVTTSRLSPVHAVDGKNVTYVITEGKAVHVQTGGVCTVRTQKK